MSPIDRAFSKLKIGLRSANRAIDTPWRRIEIILDSITPKNSTNDFQEVGYQLSMGECARRFVFKLSWGARIHVDYLNSASADTACPAAASQVKRERMRAPAVSPRVLAVSGFA